MHSIKLWKTVTPQNEHFEILAAGRTTTAKGTFKWARTPFSWDQLWKWTTPIVYIYQPLALAQRKVLGLPRALWGSSGLHHQLTRLILSCSTTLCLRFLTCWRLGPLKTTYAHGGNQGSRSLKKESKRSSPETSWFRGAFAPEVCVNSLHVFAFHRLVGRPERTGRLILYSGGADSFEKYTAEFPASAPMVYKIILPGPRKFYKGVKPSNCPWQFSLPGVVYIGGSLVGVWNGWGYGITFFRALNF